MTIITLIGSVGQEFGKDTVKMVCLCSMMTVTLLLLVFIHSVVSNSLKPHELQQARFPCLSLSLGVCSKSCPLSWWCLPAISPSVIPFSSCLQSKIVMLAGKNLQAVGDSMTGHWNHPKPCSLTIWQVDDGCWLRFQLELVARIHTCGFSKSSLASPQYSGSAPRASIPGKKSQHSRRVI